MQGVLKKLNKQPVVNFTDINQKLSTQSSTGSLINSGFNGFISQFILLALKAEMSINQYIKSLLTNC